MRCSLYAESDLGRAASDGRAKLRDPGLREPKRPRQLSLASQVPDCSADHGPRIDVHNPPISLLIRVVNKQT